MLSCLLLLALPSQAATSRTSVVQAALTAANAGLSASARDEKYSAMAEGPFAFYRGSNPLFWMDLGDGAWLDAYGGDAETRTWLCGDGHVGNIGAFQDDQGDIVFALNDFDEAVIADYQLDVLRLATSLVLVARDNGGFSAGDEEDAVDAFTEAYLDAMADYATNHDEEDRTFRASNTSGPLDDFLDDVESTHSRSDLLDQWTIKVSSKRVLDTSGNPDLAAVSSAVKSDLTAAISAYRGTLTGGGASLPSSYFKVKSVAERLHAGVGSLGVKRYYVLIEGPSTGQSDDRILDVKAQGAPSAWGLLDAAAQADTEDASGGDHAARGVIAAKALGVHVDDLLGTLTLSGQRYSVREVSPYKASFPTDELTSDSKLQSMAAQWGALLATQHARADQDWDSGVFPFSLDDQIDARTDGDHSGFRALMRAMAVEYADQVELDYASFLMVF